MQCYKKNTTVLQNKKLQIFPAVPNWCLAAEDSVHLKHCYYINEYKKDNWKTLMTKYIRLDLRFYDQFYAYILYLPKMLAFL